MRKVIDGRKPAIPPGRLLFGVANSDHQCEAFDPKYPDIRDTWEAHTGKVTRGRATDFWNRFADDIRNARSLGCDIFRFSVSWARVEPVRGRINSTAISHYRKIIETIRKAGMQPLLTLHHFAWPVWLEDLGGMAWAGFPGLFARYAETVARRIGPQVPYWDTINEPTVLIFGYLKPWWQKEYFFPPGSNRDLPMDRQIKNLGKVIRNLFLAHTAARWAIRRVNPTAMVGTNPAMLGLPRWATWLLDRIMTWVISDKRLQGNLGRIAERGFLLRKRADIVLGALSRTSLREEKIDFSEGYLRSGHTLLARSENPRVSLKKPGARIAVVRTSTATAAVGAHFPSAKIVEFKDAHEALAAVDRGAGDAFMTDSILAAGIQERFPARYRVAARLADRGTYAAGVRKGSSEWLRVVNDAIRHFKESGALERSVRHHFPDAWRDILPAEEEHWQPALREDRAALRGRASRTPTDKHGRRRSELRAIQRRGFLTVAVKNDVPGLCIRDARTGEWSGVEVDLARAVARQVFGDPARVRFKSVRTQRRIPQLRSVFRLFDPLLKAVTILTSVANSNWWHLGMAGRLDPFLCPRKCVGQQDYVGFDYYWGVPNLRLGRLGSLFDALMKGQYRRAPVWPGGLGEKLRYLSRLFPKNPIMILENGSVVTADGITREEYLRRHVAEVLRGRRAGFNLMGYICWSITTNRELGAPFNDESDFGLFHVKLDTDSTLRRRRTPAAAVYRQIIKEERRREERGE